MKIFIYSYFIILVIQWLVWLFYMLYRKPTYKYSGKNNFMGNWNEGGNIVFCYTFGIAFFVALGVIKLFVMFSLIDNL